MVAGGIAVAVLAGCATSASTTQTSATPTISAVATPSATSRSTPAGPSPAISPARGRKAADWDVDGDGRRDRARLVYLGGYGPDNWELVVDMTTPGQQTVASPATLSCPATPLPRRSPVLSTPTGIATPKSS